MNSAGRRLAESAFSIACMPYEAFYSLGAILRTFWRMLITHKRLLEWNTAADTKRNSRTGLAGSYLTMWIAPVMAAAAAIYLALTGRPRLSPPGRYWGSGLPHRLSPGGSAGRIDRKETRLSAEQTGLSPEYFP